jgi:hypothetical protein
MYVQYCCFRVVPATIPISVYLSSALAKTSAEEGSTGRYISSKTVVFLESGNDITTKQNI